MKRYKIKYTDCGESREDFINACDSDHAEEKFWDSIIDWQGDSYGIVVLGVTLAKTRIDYEN